jgi:hypothetical protein
MFEKIAKWYKFGLWSAEMVQNAVSHGIIGGKINNENNTG